jgi:hypothetical protein
VVVEALVLLVALELLVVVEALELLVALVLLEALEHPAVVVVVVVEVVGQTFYIFILIFQFIKIINFYILMNKKYLYNILNIKLFFPI